MYRVGCGQHRQKGTKATEQLRLQEGKTEEELRADMHFLYNLWMDIRQKAEKKKAPALIHHDLDLVQRILRDQLTSSFKNVWVEKK